MYWFISDSKTYIFRRWRKLAACTCWNLGAMSIYGAGDPINTLCDTESLSGREWPRDSTFLSTTQKLAPNRVSQTSSASCTNSSSKDAQVWWTGNSELPVTWAWIYLSEAPCKSLATTACPPVHAGIGSTKQLNKTNVGIDGWVTYAQFIFFEKSCQDKSWEKAKSEGQMLPKGIKRLLCEKVIPLRSVLNDPYHREKKNAAIWPLVGGSLEPGIHNLQYTCGGLNLPMRVNQKKYRNETETVTHTHNTHWPERESRCAGRKRERPNLEEWKTKD